MSKIILQPFGNPDAHEHYSNTIEKPITLASISQFLSKQQFKSLQEIYPNGVCEIWGVVPGQKQVNVKKWERIDLGDITLFADAGIKASGLTTLKLHNRDLALHLWGLNNNGETWEYIYFLDNIKTHNISYKDFSKAAGYSGGYVVRKFDVLGEEISKRIIQDFDLLINKKKDQIQQEFKRYWAGGFHWDETVSKLEDFLHGGIWEIGWSREDPKGKTTYALVSNVKVGDQIALKSLGGKHVLKISAIGTVQDISEAKSGILKVDWNKPQSYYHGDAPKGKGSGNWFGTLVEVAREQDIKMIFDLGTFYPELVQFISQARTGNLKTKQFRSTYLDLQVKVSFGQGVEAKIPWISFLGKDQTTSKGIYPVYLYYKSVNKLILSYGVSETNVPSVSWNNPDQKENIASYFARMKLGIPERYGKSFIFQVYDSESEIDPDRSREDLTLIISEYKELLNKTSEGTKTLIDMKQVKFNSTTFLKDANKAGLKFTEELVARFSASLCTKPFVILTGLSGSGKTKLAQSFAQWICQNDGQYCLVPVGADWTNREPLLGYPNALRSEEYVKPENGVLDLVIRAENNEALPYFLILDEMNLSHVERYFADFLSTMESGEVISLHSDERGKKDGDGNYIKQELGLPKNLFIVGTVNIDETTYMFSPKVLDRANTIEFRVNVKDMESFLSKPSNVDLKLLNRKGAAMGVSFVKIAKAIYTSGNSQKVNSKLIDFFIELKKAGVEYGYRTAEEVTRLMQILDRMGVKNANSKLDIAIMQKLLPKIHGSRSKITKVLSPLGALCLKDAQDMQSKYFDNIEDEKFESDSNVLYPLSFAKIARMYKNALDNGFASYAEA